MTAIQNVFKRTDPQVQEDALSLDLEGFKRKYQSQAKETVLAATWKDANKKKKQEEQTDTANDLPAPKPIKETVTTMSDGSVLTNQTFANGVQVASVDSEPSADLKADKKKGKKGAVETAAPEKKAQPAKADGTKTRAERLRELIAEGKDKPASKQILIDEGFDVATIHSEWNRLTKKKD